METGVTPSAHAAALWVGLHLLLLLVLSVLVVRQRQRHRVLIGDEGVPDLLRARRAFGNATEYVPAGIGPWRCWRWSARPPLVIHGVGAVLFVGRVTHGSALSVSAGATLGRTAGTLADLARLPVRRRAAAVLRRLSDALAAGGALRP